MAASTPPYLLLAVPGEARHPGRPYYLLTIGMSLLSFLMAVIAILVPWSFKDTAVLERAHIGLWHQCIETTNEPSTYTCQRADLAADGSVCGGQSRCQTLFLAMQALAVGGAVFCSLALVSGGATIGRLWVRPTGSALCAAVSALSAFLCCLWSFLLWYYYAEQDWRPGSPLFPLQGYSWGWVCMVWACWLSFLATVAAYLGLSWVRSAAPLRPPDDPAASL